MRMTQSVLSAKTQILNNMLSLEPGGRYYVGYENGGSHLFKEAGSGRYTILYGATKNDVANVLDSVIKIIEREELSRKGE